MFICRITSLDIYERIKALAYCDTINGGGGWLVVQSRQDGSVDFNRTWLDYEDGFGMLTGEFWYGLRALHCLTGQSGWEMRMDIKLANGKKIFLQYEQFKVASAKDKYKPTVGGFQGTITDPIIVHNGKNFSTIHNDNDPWFLNCAIDNWSFTPTGGWWYTDCAHLQFNTLHNHRSAIRLNNQWHSLPFTEIKIQSHNCNISHTTLTYCTNSYRPVLWSMQLSSLCINFNMYSHHLYCTCLYRMIIEYQLIFHAVSMILYFHAVIQYGTISLVNFFSNILI